MDIIEASIKDVEQVAVLFNEYRMFYAQKSDIESAKVFLEERITRSESVIFIAIENDEYVAFTQLYPSFTSVGISRIWLLNDLYVLENYRKKGIAEQLIKHVFNYGKTTERKKVLLSTDNDNFIAQKLYERIGFVRDNCFFYEKVI